MKPIKLVWYDPTNKEPSHEEQVLICCHATYNVATYNSYKKGFELKGGAFLPVNKYPMEWAGLLNPTC